MAVGLSCFLLLLCSSPASGKAFSLENFTFRSLVSAQPPSTTAVESALAAAAKAATLPSSSRHMTVDRVKAALAGASTKPTPASSMSFFSSLPSASNSVSQDLMKMNEEEMMLKLKEAASGTTKGASTLLDSQQLQAQKHFQQTFSFLQPTETSRIRAHRVEFPDGNYTGELNGFGQRHGWGEMNWRNGTLYGPGGMFIYSNGDRYVGQWMNHKQHGKNERRGRKSEENRRSFR